MCEQMEQGQLERLWTEHRAVIDERIELLDGVVDAMRRDAPDPELTERAARAAHQLAGSVGTFGFTRAGELARSFQRELLEGDGPSPEIVATLSELVVEIRSELGEANEATGEDGHPDRPASLPLVVFAVSEGQLAQRLRLEASRRGLRAAVTNRLKDLADLARRQGADAVVLDAACEEAGTGGWLQVLSDLHRDAPDVPMLLLGVDDGLEPRFAAARAGAGCYLDAGATPTEVIDQVALMLQARAAAHARILVVSAEATDAAPAVVALRDAGLTVETVTDTQRVWEELRRVSPSMVIVDGNADGLDLVRVLRNDRRWSSIPLLAVAGPDSTDRVFAAGADDLLTLPLDADALLARVTGRLERYRIHQALAETDALTGLANRRTSTAALGQLLRLAERMDRPLCLVEVDVDHFKGVNDRYGHLAGDVVLRRLGDLLRRSFRAEDVVARWGGEEFIVGLLGLERDPGIDHVQELLAAFRTEEFTADERTFSLTFSAGVAQYPTDGKNLEELYAAADEALYAAKKGGRDQVVGAGVGGRLTEQVDVAIVEDDELTAAAAAANLGDLGHRCWRFSNGASAAAALTGDSPRVRARVILLDLDIPAVDGFELLTLLARDGILRSSTVIVVSANEDRKAIQRTRALGAVDYFVKPAPVDELSERIDEALGRRPASVLADAAAAAARP